jgi:uncharacterized protein (TIGR03118 family)
MQHTVSKSSRLNMQIPDIGRRWPAAITVIVAAAGLLALAAPAGASATPPGKASNSFGQTNLIANKASFKPKLVDKNLTNAWGLAGSSSTPLWISDNNSGLATAYGGGVNGSSVSVEITEPIPGGNPTGQVFNSSSAFPVGGSGGSPASFIVSTDSIGKTQSPGEIAAWDGGSSFVVEDSPKGGPGGKTPAKAVFKGLALATTPKAGPELFAADVANAKVDIFNRDFHLVKMTTEFRDSKIPAGYAPFNVQELNSQIYVTYVKQNKAKTDGVPGAGLGFVDVYTVNGKLVHHLISHGSLNEPWGLAIAPKGFGPFAGDLLVGNLGNGWINAFNPTTGKHLGALDTTGGKPIVISGLWGLRVGTSTFGGSSALIFSSGPNGQTNGLVGILKPAKSTGGGGW